MIPLFLLTLFNITLSVLSWKLDLLFPESLTFIWALYLGFILNLIAQNLNKAKLKITAIDDSKNTIGHQDGKQWKFIHIKVENIRRNKLLEWLIGSKIALFTRATVKFFEPSTNASFFSVDGRWSSTGEPLSKIIQNDQIRNVFDYAKVPELRFEHILPGESVNLAVAIKIDGQNGFYGFSNYSYAFPIFQNTEWLINRDISIIEVEIYSGNGERVVQKFTITNPNAEISNFRIQ